MTPAYLRALRGSHFPIFRALVLDTGQHGRQTGADPIGVEIPIEGGNIRFDASADVRATLDLSTTPAFWPAETRDPITPYGPEIFIAGGLVLAGGQRVYVSQGYYRIEDVDQPDAPRGAVRISGKDRMAGIIDARLEAPVQFLAGASVHTVFQTLVLDVYPDAEIEFDFDATSTTFPGSHVTEQDRHGFLDDIVRALGKTWYFDYRGVLVVKSPPDPSAPVWTINHGRDGVLVRAGRKRSRTGVYNAVVATGEAAGDTPAVRAVARDVDPASPTRWGGPFGKVPRFYSSPFITTTAQAATAAASMLTNINGLPYSVNFTSIVNHALEVLDPVGVSYADRERSEVHVIDKLATPLTVDEAMTGNTRDQSSVNVEVDAA